MHIGDVIEERFQILAHAGTGGMGTVYRAVDLADGLHVALKLIRNPDGVSRVRFSQEAQVLAQIKHDHVVRYVAHGFTSSHEPYLVMEWLEGETLADRLCRGKMAPADAIRLTRTIANALGVAHAQGIVHRDIKPNNLFLVHGDIDHVKVLDFGIAYRTEATTLITAAGMVLGTPGYMSPEQARGDQAPIDARADVFSLGCVFFECLTGQPAFQGAHAVAVLAKLLLTDPPRVRDLVKDIPKEVDAVVLRMLAKNPDDRPRDGSAAYEELAKLDTRADGVVTSPPSTASAGITAMESHVVSVVVMIPVAQKSQAQPDSTILAENALSLRLPELRAAAEPFRARIEELAGGAVVAVVSGVGHVTDQAALAARCALRFRTLLPDAEMVLVTGRSDDSGRLQLGERLDQAAILLAHRSTERTNENHSHRIGIDGRTRALLDVRFEVVERDGFISLEGERIVDNEARTLLGQVSPFVGRDRELRRLLEYIHDGIDDSHACAMLVTGGAGFGKSRLRYELLKTVRRSLPQVGIAIGRGDSISAGSSYGLLAGAIRNRFGITVGEAIAVQQEKLMHAVQDLVQPSDQARIQEFLGEIIGTHFPDASSPMLKAARQSPPLMAEQIQCALIDFLGKIVERRPALLVLEDLHWGDAPSVKVIDAALRVLKELPFIVLAFGRPEVHDEFPKLWVDRNCQEIRLRELPRRAAEQLVRSMLPQLSDAAKVEAIVQRADGNAFYLEELIRVVAEGQEEIWPETVLGMVAARLAALDSASRRILRAASIFGEVFWARGIPTLLGEGQSDDGRERLSALVAGEVLIRRPESRLSGQEEYAFRHALLREGAYATLTDRDRLVGHRLVGEWLEQAGETDPKLLAEHFSLGGEGERAASYYLRAGEVALEGSDFATARRWAEKGIALGRNPELLAHLWAVASDAAYGSGDFEWGLLASDRALESSRPGSRSHCRGLSSLMGAALFLRRGDIGNRVIEALLPTNPDENAIAPLVAGFSNAILSLAMGSPRSETERSMRRLEEIAARTPADDDLAQAWIEQSRATWKFSIERDPWAAVAHTRAALVHSERAGDKSQIARTEVSLGWYISRLGLFKEAEPHFLSSATKTSSASPVAMIRMGYHACMEVDRGAFSEARKIADEIIRIADTTGEKFISLSARLNKVEMRIAEGDLECIEDEMLPLGQSPAMTTSRQLWYFAVLAQMRLAQGRPREALAYMTRSRDLSRALQVESFRHAYILLVHAETQIALEDEDAAREAIREAYDDLMAHATQVPDAHVRRSYLENFSIHTRTLALAREWNLATANPAD